MEEEQSRLAKWNPWHGCHKISAGCRNCYVYRIDARHDRDSSIVKKTKDFDLPLRRDRAGKYRLSGREIVYTCFSSDFFLEDADEWRKEAWDMIRARQDLHFFIVTKRIHRFHECLPGDWGNGYENVTICCTVENQERADFRLPLFRNELIRHKSIICEPILENINLSPYLSDEIEEVTVGGESGPNARLCRFDWVQNICVQCRKAGVPFTFKQTGARFEKDGRIYQIPRKEQHSQAQKAGINTGR
jgi:protein gp37